MNRLNKIPQNLFKNMSNLLVLNQKNIFRIINFLGHLVIKVGLYRKHIGILTVKKFLCKRFVNVLIEKTMLIKMSYRSSINDAPFLTSFFRR